MAKVLTPLMSFSARGAIAKTMVFFPWKGINAVRQYVVPANPKTDAQQAQRAHVTAAVLEWHGASYTTADRSAWRVYAGVLVKIMAGFNAMCKVFIIEKIKGNTWERLTGVVIGDVIATEFRVDVEKASGGNAPTLRWGTSKLYMPESATMADQGGNVWSKYAKPLIANTGYWFYIDVGTLGTDYGRTGIYYQRTLA